MNSSQRSPERVPPAALLHYAALLTGFGTVFLGPCLPTLTTSLHLSDRGGGALLAAQFTGAFLGGWTTRAPLHRCMLRGYSAAAAGFALLAVTLAGHPSIAWAIGALLLLGFGIGQVITSNNLLAALRWTTHRGAALALLNFTWSAGALCAPLFLPTTLARFAPTPLFALVAALLSVGVLVTRFSPVRIIPARDEAAAATGAGLSRRTLLYFSLLLVLYGGVETSMGGWLTTYDLRYTTAARAFAASAAAFWICLTGARALASALLLRVTERLFLRATLTVAVVAMSLLLAAHGPLIPVLAGLTGAALAPWFSLVFSGLVSEGPTATQAGRIIAVSGLGAAALPWLVGEVSARTGSLRLALVLPIIATVALLALSFRKPPAQNQHRESV